MGTHQIVIKVLKFIQKQYICSHRVDYQLRLLIICLFLVCQILYKLNPNSSCLKKDKYTEPNASSLPA